MKMRSKRWTFRAWGPWACWTPMAFRSERISSLVPSHSAVVGLLRGLLGKWEITWDIHEVRLLAKPRRVAVVGNELKFNQVDVTKPIIIEKDRTQRTTVFLRDVDIAFDASLRLTPHAGSDDSIQKYEAITERRARTGQLRRQIYFGIRECMANLELVEDPSSLPSPVDLTEDLGISFFDTDWDDPEKPDYFAHLAINKGVVRYPSWEEVKALGICRASRRAS